VVGACFVRTHGNVTEDGQENVDEEVGVATTLEEDTQRWEHDGEDDLADVAGEAVSSYPQKHTVASYTYLAVKGMLAVYVLFLL
jgi:hypothetical protein